MPRHAVTEGKQIVGSPTARTTRTVTSARQRDAAGPSARSLLLTVLGEFCYPRDGRVWTGTLVEALGSLGIEEKSARQALSRTASEGVLTPTRHGRRVQWGLTDEGAELLREGTGRIYSFLREPRAWDGRWLVVTVGVPESQRKLRHRLRARLTWLGMGSPSPGLWVVPDATKEGEARGVLRDLGLLDHAFAWAGPAVSTGDLGRMLSSAWDLGDVEKRYLSFIDRFDGLHAEGPEQAFVHQVQLIEEWRRFPFLDPDLPTELLSPDWPGPRAAGVFHDRHDRWHRRAQGEWERMDRDAATRT
jgi:phenylacetic acid degradation operon negative regulatory protein